MRKNRPKCQVVLIAFKAKSSSEWCFDNSCSRHVTGDKTFFTFFQEYNGGIVTFKDESLACVKGKGNISIIGCPKLDGVLYVNGLKANLLSISKIYDKDHGVNFCQDLCEVVNKEGKVIIIGHRVVNKF